MKHVIQVAGIHDAREARMLIECGVDLLGFPLRLDVHEEDITETEAARIISRISPPHAAVLITYLNNADDMSELSRHLGVSWVQVHGDMTVDEFKCVAQRNPGLRFIKSIIVGEAHRGDEACEACVAGVDEWAPYVDAFIMDTFDPETGARGATGRVHDWNVSRRIVEYSPRPVMLAGGLTPENVAEAIRRVAPAGVDAHTGVEGADGRKDRERVRRFVAEARRAFAATG